MTQTVMRPVRKIHHFEPKSDAALRDLEAHDPSLAKDLRARRQSRPYGHDSILLTCGHVASRVRPAAKHLWVTLPCPQCTVRNAEMAVRQEEGKRRREQELTERAEARSLGEEVMATKKAVAATKKSAPTKRAWKQSYRWEKALKLEPPADGVKGVIYKAIQSIKKGNADEVAAAAVKGGLKNYTKQDPRTMTKSILRQFAESGCIKIVRDEDMPASAATKSTPARKKLVVKKSAPVKDVAAAGA